MTINTSSINQNFTITQFFQMAGNLGKRDKEGKETTGEKENKRNGEKE